VFFGSPLGLFLVLSFAISRKYFGENFRKSFSPLIFFLHQKLPLKKKKKHPESPL
jgi:hypothetical protein